MTQEQKLYLSIQLIRIGQLVEIARILTDLLTKERFVGFGTKDALKGILRNIEQAKIRLVSMLTKESRERNDKDVMDEESVLRTCTLIDLLMAMDKPRRERLEEYAQSLYDEYNQSEAA